MGEINGAGTGSMGRVRQLTCVRLLNPIVAHKGCLVCWRQEEAREDEETSLRHVVYCLESCHASNWSSSTTHSLNSSFSLALWNSVSEIEVFCILFHLGAQSSFLVERVGVRQGQGSPKSSIHDLVIERF